MKGYFFLLPKFCNRLSTEAAKRLQDLGVMTTSAFDDLAGKRRLRNDRIIIMSFRREIFIGEILMVSSG